MQIYSTVAKLCDKHSNIAIALGTFDGIHIGHQKIIGRAVELAKNCGGTSVVFTFSNHPLSIVDPTRCPIQLVTNEYKAELMLDLGVDILMNIPFTAELLKMSPTDFIELLRSNLNPTNIVVGPNYSFGFRSAGTPNLLAQAGNAHHFNVEVHPAVYLDGNIVSSTLIRQHISEGNVSEAARLLGRNFKLKGEVVTGDKRGRTLGFPTANINIPDGFAVPDNGVYAVSTSFDTMTYNSIANIGTNPTFKGNNRHIEVHLLDFDGNLYGKSITVEFLAKIRDEKTFSGANDLIKQISQDIATARNYY
ncbi:bifunctional riboflavin kinase/FAD synthetase [Dendrosporobacter sp. 1207_IL3150]|uniref:bifunctional riboflavin kinase/FAD synthetase n=1 Tax=Dendrosporobacter sp. 1207_IL3150 TaxID=3084054 RepID=UPI002FD8E9A7